MFTAFIGTYEHNIDEKNRITFPSRFRELLGDGAFVMRGFDNNLIIMSKERFNQLYERVHSLNFADPNVRELQRFLYGNAFEFEFDKNGRFIIPQTLRTYAQLSDSAIVLGAGDKIEIWAPDIHSHKDEHFESPNAAAELISKFDLTF